MKQNAFITIEGVDGCGKSTVIEKVYNELLKVSQNTFLTREPGGVEISEQIRSVILDNKNTKMDVMTEALLYSAARRQHLVEKIIPALHKKNGVVLCDRFIDSSFVYQGRKLESIEESIDIIGKINEPAISVKEFNILRNGEKIDLLIPDLTILFDLDVEIAMERSGKRDEKDRFDAQGKVFFEKVIEDYRTLANHKNNKDRIKIVDASKSIEDVTAEVLKIILDFLNKQEK